MNTRGYITKVGLVFFDLLSTTIAFIFSIHFLDANFNLYSNTMLIALIPLLVIRMISLFLFKTYLSLLRYIGEKDFIYSFYAVVFSSIFYYILIVIFPSVLPIEEAELVVFIYSILAFFLVFLLRGILVYSYRRLLYEGADKLNTVIFGSGELGKILSFVFESDNSSNYNLVGFFDDNPKIHGKYFNGVRIYNPETDFADVITKKEVKVAVIGVKDLERERKIKFIEQCLELGVKVLKVPSPDHWLNSKLSVNQIESINLDDLLNRPSINLQNQNISKFLEGKTILVTGCAGSIGSEIVRQLVANRPKSVIGVDYSESALADETLDVRRLEGGNLFQPILADIRNINVLRNIFEKNKPDIVFHAAAYKHVPIMERFPREAVLTNILGSMNLADLAHTTGVEKFVLISTDKAVNPSNVMGASKRIAEIYTQSLNFVESNNTQFITTRFGNVLGSNGSVIPIFKKQIQKRENITVTHPDITRFFMTIPEACQLVLEAGTLGNGGEILIFDMGEPVKIMDLAKKMIQLSGLKEGVDIGIEIKGLRPGEKLYEELLDDKETLIPTHHDKIKKALVRPYEFEQISKKIKEVVGLAENISVSEDKIILRMKDIVPEFISQNSKFSKIDEK